MFPAVLGGTAMGCLSKMRSKKHLIFRAPLRLKHLGLHGSMKNAAALSFAIRKSGKRSSTGWGAGSISTILTARWTRPLWRVFGGSSNSFTKKGYVYEGLKVMPFSAKLGTPLSNFEASENYKDVDDPSLTVAFQSLDEPNLYFLAWTTTPWTLVSNLALMVSPLIEYVRSD